MARPVEIWTVPIIQAPMAGGATTPELVAAVSNAGGLGSLGAGYMTPDEIKKTIQAIRALTDKPFAVNLFIPETTQATDQQIKQMAQHIELCCRELHIEVPTISAPYLPTFDMQLQVIYEEKVPVFSFTFGIPDAVWIKKLKAHGTVLMGTATNLEEGLLLEKNKIDYIVAQGREAGGHRGTFIGEAEDALTPLSVLVSQLMSQVKTPIVAAGGIMDNQGIKTALSWGAVAVQMGTAFLSCEESGIHPSYKQALLTATHDQTALTRAFSGKLARGIHNVFMERMEVYQDEFLPYPIQHALTMPMRKESAKKQNINFMSLWAGQSMALCQSDTVAALMHRLMHG